MTVEVAGLFPPQGQWTEAAYLSLPDSNRIVELSEGTLVVPDLPTDPHQYAVGELFAEMRAYVRKHHLGHIRVAPLRVRLWPEKFREPDIVFLSRAHEDRKGEDFWGVPDLVVEVLSPRTERSSGTERTDRGDKFEEYARAGVMEYWIVDPTAGSIEVYILQDGVYRLSGSWIQGQTARSETLKGFALPVAAILEG